MAYTYKLMANDAKTGAEARCILWKEDNAFIAMDERYVLHPGTLDASDNLVDTDISSEPAEVQAVCNAVWPTDVKNAYKAKLIADKAE